MSLEFPSAVVALGAVLLALMGLTATGGHRRGQGVAGALAAGLFFPITWVVWYVRDERPWRPRSAWSRRHRI
jgi:hypothetical protein